LLLGSLFALVALLSVGYVVKDRYAYRGAELSRSIIGDEATARVESWYLAAQDRLDRIKYSLLGGDTNPFSDGTAVAHAAPVAAQKPPRSLTEPGAIVEATEDWFGALTQGTPAPALPVAPAVPAAPPPLYLPQTKPLRPSLAEGEGMWTTNGLPFSTPENVLMAKTFVRPDAARPYASVGVLLIDKRRVRLHMMGGTEDPGGDLGIKGPGAIPEEHKRHLLAAWNGGFRGPHGGFGMVADGKQYRPLRNGYASVAVTRDGTIRMGQWGRDIFWSEDTIAVRQNAVLLVDGCEVSKRTAEGNNTWGYVQVNSAEFITWRSAIGLTEHGDLLVASGNSLSAATLARALWAAGACYAMQLDINSPYVLTSLFFPQADGSLGRAKFMDSMPDNPARFLNRQARDFMYVTWDETNFKP
jgi:hypothetical protein